MKNSLLLLALCALCGLQNLNAQQNVGIGTTAPNASAALDIVATNKGLLIPRMTEAQRNAIASPANGLLVYQTTAPKGFYYCEGGVWAQIGAGGGGGGNWALNGDDISNTNADAVAIGTPTPDANAVLDVTSTTKGILIPRMTFAQRQAMPNAPEGMLIYQTDNTPGFYYCNSNPVPGMFSFTRIDAGIGTVPPALWQLNGNNMNSAVLGNVGIGTTTPSTKLEVNGTAKTTQMNIGGASTVGYLSANGSDLGIQGNQPTAGSADPASHLRLHVDYPNLKQGNVCIGGNNVFAPTRSRFEVISNGLAGTTNAIFGGGQAGISLQQKWPTIGFNQYRDNANGNTSKFMSTGYAMLQHMNPANGVLAYEALGTGAANANCPVSGNLVMQLAQDGHVVVGNPNLPQSQLEVVAPGDAALQIVGPSPYIGFNRISNNTQIGFIRMWGDVPSPAWNRNGLEMGTPPGASRALMFSTNYTQRMHIEHNGQVVIGSGNAASGYLLNVRGKAICEELRVLLTGNWPDYVFKPGYKLRPLAEVEKHIAENGHLPGIQPASEIEQNGLDLGAMQTKAMEKIEELTLYLIQLKKENDDLRARVEALENRH